jgi:catechol 2,3-dioxygenase-like lactoylglutathione lyase family enzyme
MSASGLDHAGVTVSDMERSLRFWRDLLGLRETGRGTVRWPHLDRLTAIPETEIEWAGLALQDGTQLELQEYRHPRGRPCDPGAEADPGRGHLGLRVENLDALAGRLEEAGAVLRSREPVLLERGAYSGWRAIYALDPDGNSVELMEPPRDEVTAMTPQPNGSVHPGGVRSGADD